MMQVVVLLAMVMMVLMVNQASCYYSSWSSEAKQAERRLQESWEDISIPGAPQPTANIDYIPPVDEIGESPAGRCDCGPCAQHLPLRSGSPFCAPSGTWCYFNLQDGIVSYCNYAMRGEISGLWLKCC